MSRKLGHKGAINDGRRLKTLNLSVPVGSSAATGNADTVDGFHASASPTANFLLALDGSALFPDSVIASTIARDSEVTAAIATHAAIDDAHHDPVTAGDGIALTGQQVAVDLSATSGLEFSSGDLQIADAIAGTGLTIASKILAVGAGDGINVAANSIAVDVTDLIGNGIVEQATNDIALGTPSTLTVATSNGVTSTSHTHAVTSSSNPGAAASLLASDASGDLTLHDLTATANLSANRVDSHLIPVTTDTYDLGSSTLLWRKGYLSEMEAVLFAENTITLLGGWFYITKYAGTVEEDLDNSETAIDLGVTDSVLAVDDFIVFRASLKVEYMQLTSYAGTNIWNVTRNVDGTGVNTWPEGAPFAAFGYDGDGRIELNAYDTPRISIIKHGTSYNAQTELIRLGDLNGLADYSSEEYGIFIGDYSGDKWLAYDETNSLRIRGDAIVDGTISATMFTNDIGAMFFSDAGGLALWGPGCKITDTAWTSTRGQVATISGAFRQVPGRWPGTRGLAVEPAGTNYIINPISGVNVTDGWTNNGMATYERSTTYAKFGSASMHLVSDATTDDVYSDTVSEADGGEDWTAVVWVYLVSGDFQVTISENDAGWTDKDSQAGGTIGRWERVVLSVELTAGVTDGRVKLEPAATAASEFYVGYVGFHPTAYALTAIYGSFGTGYTWSGTAHNSTSTRTATEVNLDAHVGLISANDTLTFATWVQMPFDADGIWPGTAYIFYARGADNDNRIYLQFYSTTEQIYLRINTTQIGSGVLTFNAGDWLHCVATHDFANNVHTLNINGVLMNTSTVASTAPALTDWVVGSTYNATAYHSGYTFSEVVVFDRVLTAAEVAAMYALQRPLVDFGAVNKPGIFILDGQFRMASSLTGNRIDITADEIAGYDSAGTKQFYLRASDGKAMAGGGIIGLGDDGIKIEQDVAASDLRSFQLVDSSGNTLGRMGGYFIDGTWNFLRLETKSVANTISAVEIVSACPTGENAKVALAATRGSGSVILSVYNSSTSTYGSISSDWRAGGGLWIGSIVDDPDPNDLHIEGSINLSTALGCRVYNNANISIPDAASPMTTLTFNSERWDDDGIHSTVSNTGRLTCVHAGVYLITATVRFAANATGIRLILFLHEGTTEIARHRVSAASAGATVISLATTYKLAATDYVQCRVYQNSGGALNVEYSADYSPVFGMTRLP